MFKILLCERTDKGTPKLEGNVHEKTLTPEEKFWIWKRRHGMSDRQIRKAWANASRK